MKLTTFQIGHLAKIPFSFSETNQVSGQNLVIEATTKIFSLVPVNTSEDSMTFEFQCHLQVVLGREKRWI
jgi:hypothetical protein